ncbi:putative membrane protein [Pontibacter aydingkolensis]|uniref:Cell wall-active antibiotics response protein n=1 Tax=Pontibacter aydingkolensis TaxID=1911536 RepID=A0ABS7CR40_9BACT|nr:cell wall-active antibiotics response protein [Pontibacter aydingkolensis]MBW7465987.1 cell wall-active antibiotics response protein [Pontibacter aydingkolensis]
MNNRDFNSNNNYGSDWESPKRSGGSGKVMAGVLLIVIGMTLLATKLNYFFLPGWVFSWGMLLVILGLFIGFKHNFRKPAWLVLVIIGIALLLNDLIPGINFKFYFWPILLIGIGLWMMLKPKAPRPYYVAPPQPQPPINDYTGGTATPEEDAGFNVFGSDASTEDYVDATAIFGGVKKNIISKNFRGGEVVSVFGGTELNMSQADLQQPAVLEATQIFGGTTLIVPAHWEVKSEAVAILGGIDDKRPIMPGGYDPSKVLIIKGTSLFGGLQIKSY